jgi:hypothetical protein
MEPFPADFELLSLFECEPTVSDSGVPWAYNCLRFDTHRGPDRVVCEIEPGYETVRLWWHRDNVEVVRLSLNWVRGLTVEKLAGVEALIALFRDPALEPLRLQLRPRVQIRWGTTVGLPPSHSVLSNER